MTDPAREASIGDGVDPSLLVELRAIVGDRLSAAGSPDELSPGSGGIVRVDGQRVAGFRDERGALHVFGAACTHLGCEVRFNEAERSWDCPCHGSRFDALDGHVLEGPAVSPLPPVR